MVIVGGGFGGLYAARALKRAPVDVTLLDRRNFHLFQPLLYQVATGGLSPANIAAPLRGVLKRQKNARVLLGEALDFDVAAREVVFNGGRLAYDYLIVATGGRHHYFGHPEWETAAPGLKTIEDATEIRRRILLAFEKAELARDPDDRRSWLNFLIVGGGPTGVELAGAVAEISRDTLKEDFRAIDPTRAQIVLIEGAERILPTYPPELSAKAQASLERLGVAVRTNAIVTDVKPEGISVKTKGAEDHWRAHTVLWAAGVAASPLGAKLAGSAGAQMDRAGRVIVGPDLTLPGHPEIFVIGDLANFSHQTGSPLPGIAPVAMQQGRYAAEAIRARLAGKTLPPFRFKDRGNMATIGRAAAVADIYGFRFSGWIAWLVWLFVHLVNLMQFNNRLLVFLQWTWNYFTRNRSARLITGEDRANVPL